jgi:hypothetical protein
VRIFAAEQMWPFAAALVIMVSLCLFQGIGLLFSERPSGWIDAFLLSKLPPSFKKLLGWFHIGKAPILMVLIFFLAGFALAGYLIQISALSFNEQMLVAWIASIPALIAGLVIANNLGGLIADSSSCDELNVSVNEQNLIEYPGVVIHGLARAGVAAEAAAHDIYDHIHYAMVKPDQPDRSV